MLRKYDKVKHFASYHELLPQISDILKESISEFDESKDELNIYCSCRCPEITIDDYLCKFVKWIFCPSHCFIDMMTILRRFLDKNTDINIHNRNIHRLIGIALILSIKVRDDHSYKNKYYCKVMGITLQDLNNLEEVFLIDIEWDLLISSNVYKKTVRDISNSRF